jgi:hypothetical protein
MLVFPWLGLTPKPWLWLGFTWLRLEKSQAVAKARRNQGQKNFHSLAHFNLMCGYRLKTWPGSAWEIPSQKTGPRQASRMAALASWLEPGPGKHYLKQMR